MDGFDATIDLYLAMLAEEHTRLQHFWGTPCYAKHTVHYAKQCEMPNQLDEEEQPFGKGVLKYDGIGCSCYGGHFLLTIPDEQDLHIILHKFRACTTADYDLANKMLLPGFISLYLPFSSLGR